MEAPMGALASVLRAEDDHPFWHALEQFTAQGMDFVRRQPGSDPGPRVFRHHLGSAG
ncbi:MAG: hypothetical protein JW751_19210 [Polyangiaceae bacterium]|nr:hypothetical protein [Polyangiaceae bacterium]